MFGGLFMKGSINVVNVKLFVKENRKLIVRLVLMSIIGILAICADIIFNIINSSLSELVVLLFSTVTVIAGLWISCYLLFLQLYKDRYPIKVLKTSYLPNMRYNFAIVVFCIVYGSIVIVIKNGIIANLYYAVVCISAIFDIMLKIYNTNKSLMINTYVDKVFQEINKELDDSKNIVNKETFKNVQYILDESIVKEEYFIVQNITERLGEVYRTFLQNSLRFVGEKANAMDIEDSFDDIVSFNISELQLCCKISSEITVEKVISQQIKNLKFCIEKNQYEWFKKYIDEYNIFVYKIQKEGNAVFVEKLYTTYRSIIKELIDEDKTEWFQYINSQLGRVVNSLVFFYDDTSTRSYCNLVTGALIFCIDKGKEHTDIYKSLFHSFTEFSSLIFKTSGAFNKVRMCYSFLFKEFLNKGYEQGLFFYEKIFEESFVISEEQNLLEFKMYCISELINKINNDELYIKLLLDKQIDVLCEIIGVKDKYQGYIALPNFESLIKDTQYSNEDFKNIKEKIFELLNNCITKDNLPMYFTLVNKLNEVLSSTEQRQKGIQEDIISIYISIIYRTRTLVNKQYLEIVFHLFETVIKDMDLKRKISASLGDYIITNISNIAQNGNKDNHMVTIKSVDLLYSFLDENEPYTFVVTSVDKKRKLYRAMFNIGMDCIENNFEEGLRRVSNSLGWFTINSIKQGQGELTLYLIERASELYKISKAMEISPKTLTFILTLFTTVGTFCCKNVAYKRYLNKVLEGISTENVSKIKTAINLRTSENDTWNHLFDNNTIELSNKFVSEFEKANAKK